MNVKGVGVRGGGKGGGGGGGRRALYIYASHRSPSIVQTSIIITSLTRRRGPYARNLHRSRNRSLHIVDQNDVGSVESKELG